MFRSHPLQRLLLGAAAAVALIASLGSSEITAAFGDTRTIAFYNIHTKETATVLYKKDGRVVAGAMDKINWAMRDWRKDEKTAMDPELVDLLWEIHTELGSKEPIHVISAYRSRGTNDMLRKTVGGQASESRHILGKAADVHFPDVPLKNLRYSALIRERGGVGYYPTSALPFVHVDTDRVRSWPRLPRYELALLFPQGRTQHQPADGGPVTAEDVRVARTRYQELSVQLAAFHDTRKSVQTPFAVADAGGVPAVFSRPPAPSGARVAALAPPVGLPVSPPVAAQPQLVEAPRIVDRPSRLTGPSSADRDRLAELAQLASLTAPPANPQLVAGPTPAVRRSAQVAPLPSLTGTQLPSTPVSRTPGTAPRVAALSPRDSGLADALRLGFGNGFVQAPAFDDEHPEELSYRPFPIAPLMTATASADDPALVTLHHPDVAKTLEMLDQAGAMPPMRLRPPAKVAALMWSQQFKGEAVNVAALSDDSEPAAAARLTSRPVQTSAK